MVMKHPPLRSEKCIATTFGNGINISYIYIYKYFNTCLLPCFNWFRPYPEGYSNKRKKRGWTENIPWF